MCPQFIEIGLPIRVGLRHAVFENADGLIIRSRLAVGEDVIIAGKAGAANPPPIRVQAYVVERAGGLPAHVEGCPSPPIEPMASGSAPAQR